MKTFKEKNFSRLRRVDIQVSLFMALVVLVLSISLSITSYTISYNSMIDMLKDRVISIYKFADKSLELKFDGIDTASDMEKPEYKEAKSVMEDIREAADVMYLYTAKRNTNGELIYVIDGLSMEDDFRYPGDLIEPEIVPAMNQALDNEIVFPSDIKKTTWGEIFICYFPLHDTNDNVIGVLGIEIDAHGQYQAFALLRLMIPIFITIFCLLSILFAVIFFRRVSNPSYNDMFTTDQLTQLKNRNAFEINFNNMLSLKIKEDVSIIIADLDNLKRINDKLGHSKGDEYIHRAAEKIKNVHSENIIPYRIGGDEFAVIVLHNNTINIEEIANNIFQGYENDKISGDVPTRISIGYASFDPSIDQDLRSTYKRADMNMYDNKKKNKKS